MKLDVESDKVLEAAESCPDASRVLRKLFPKVFERQDLTRNLIPIRIREHEKLLSDRGEVQVRNDGAYKGFGIYFSGARVTPEIIMEGAGGGVVIFHRKGK